MDLKKLNHFLIQANQKGYAANGEGNSIKETDGSETFLIKAGDWKEHDNYFGGEPYGGRTVVFYKGKPVWMMVYYGAVKENVQNFEYQNNWQGSLKSFSGKEKILAANKQVYWAKYVGGLINLRQD